MARSAGQLPSWVARWCQPARCAGLRSSSAAAQLWLTNSLLPLMNYSPRSRTQSSLLAKAPDRYKPAISCVLSGFRHADLDRTRTLPGVCTHLIYLVEAAVLSAIHDAWQPHYAVIEYAKLPVNLTWSARVSGYPDIQCLMSDDRTVESLAPNEGVGGKRMGVRSRFGSSIYATRGALLPSI